MLWAPATIIPLQIAHNPSIPLSEVLEWSGWDRNAANPKTPLGKGQRLLSHVISMPELVIWLVEHEVHADGGDLDSINLRPLPLLDTCAARSSLGTLRLSQGEKENPHEADLRGAKIGANPLRQTLVAVESEETSKKIDVEVLLKYLVEGMGLDVNAVATDIPWGYGTPISHAAS